MFIEANQRFLASEQIIIQRDVSERALCASLMCFLRNEMEGDIKFSGYYVDVEYNRNITSSTELQKKQIKNENGRVEDITCDLIIHSRGNNAKQDNLLALEMKKVSARDADIDSDRRRLVALTQQSDKSGLEEYACSYTLGILYLIDCATGDARYEFFSNGKRLRNSDV
jgi:hypothetical protein